jgi:hypothetical protein
MNWDAWMIWDLKVKAVLQEGLFPVRYWHDPGYRYSHPEYPLGWPWLLAAVAKGAGGYDSRILRLVSPIFLPALGALCAALAVEVGAPGAAWLVAGAVTLLPLTVEYGSNGYVDLPLTVALTGAMMALLRARRGASRGALVGAWAGAVGWLKQEGLIAGAACVIALAWSARRDPRRSRVAGEAAVAWMAICGPWLVLRTWHHLGSEEFGAWTPALLAELPGRSWLILRALVRETLGPGRVGAGWLHHLPESWLLFWYVALPALVLGWRRVWRPGRRELAVVVAAQAATMVGAYLVTNWNPAILIGTSLDRLLLQMTPGLAILAAVAMSPESPPARGGRRGAK